MGRSRGGFSTKIHALITERGELIRYVVTGGEVNDVTQAAGLVSTGVSGRGVVGDRAYDSNAFLAHLEQLGLEAIIPARKNRVTPRELDKTLYGRRNVVERWFGRLKAFRRIATRYEKTTCSYEGFFALGSFVVAASGWKG